MTFGGGGVKVENIRSGIARTVQLPPVTIDIELPEKIFDKSRLIPDLREGGEVY